MPALLSLAASGRTGTTTLRLDPAELGRLDIRIARVPGGGTEVSLTATRPATLDLLVRDQAALHQTLDQAGIPLEGRSVSFHLAASPDTPAAAAAPEPSAANPAGHPQPAHPAPQPSAGAQARGEAADSAGAGVGGGHLGSQNGSQEGGSGGDGAPQGGQRPSGGGRLARAWPAAAAGATASSVAPGRTAIDITA